MANLTSSTESSKLKTHLVSFELNSFWHHVKIVGNVGTDQHGDRWFLRNGKLYSEFGYHVIDIAPRYKDVNEEIDRMIEEKIEGRVA